MSLTACSSLTGVEKNPAVPTVYSMHSLYLPDVFALPEYIEVELIELGYSCNPWAGYSVERMEIQAVYASGK